MNENIEMSEKGTKKSAKRSLIRLSMKSRKLIKYLILFLCVFGLIFQTVELLIQYKNGQTVVNIKVEIIKYNRIPAITVCYPQFISMERTAEKYENLKPLFDNYKNQLKNASEKDFNDKTFRYTMNELYEKNFSSFVLEKSNSKITDLYDLSIPFIIPEKSSYFNANFGDLIPIEVKVSGMRLYPNGTISKFVVDDTSPVESIVFPYNGKTNKCFTFFSHLNESLRQYQMDVERIEIDIYNNENWFPPTIYDNSMISFAIHSPNVIPNRMNVNNFLKLRTKRTYEMTYNRWKTILLPPPYKTNCKNYDMDDKQDYRLRSDCINRCIYEELNKKCSHCLSSDKQENNNNCTDCLFRGHYLWRRDSFESNDLKDLSLCPDFHALLKVPSSQLPKDQRILWFRSYKKQNCIRDNMSAVNNKCQSKCHPECTNRFYNYYVTNIEKSNLGFKEWSTLVKIAHNQLPDQINEHIPEMTFITFACNFGGLLGMWMGLSALAILHYVLKSL